MRPLHLFLSLGAVLALAALPAAASHIHREFCDTTESDCTSASSHREVQEKRPTSPAQALLVAAVSKGRSVMNPSIEIGYEAFLKGQKEKFGAIRGLDPRTLTVWVEHAGDYPVLRDAIDTVVEQKVVFDPERLEPGILEAIRHARDAETGRSEAKGPPSS